MTPETIEAKETPKGVSLFRTLVMSFSVVAIMSCLTIGLMTYYLRAQDIRQQQYRFLETLRDEKIRNFESWLEERFGDVAVMVARPDIIDFCRIHSEGRDTADHVVRSAITTVQRNYRYEAVFLADAKGSILVSTEAASYAPGSLPLREKNLLRAIAEKKTIISDVLISKVHKRPTIFLFEPILDTKTSELIGVLGILMDPAVLLYPLFTRSSYLGETGEILMVNRAGLAQSPLKYDEGAIASTTIRAAPAQRGASGAHGLVATADYRGVDVMAAYGHIDVLDWGIVVKQDVAEINASVKAMARNVTSASAGVLCIALLAGLLISRRISRPALKIADIAAEIGDGNLDVRVQKEGPREIQEIALNLNSMADQLVLRSKVSEGVGRIVATAGKHSNVSALLGEVLPVIMEETRSQFGVVYCAGVTENKLDQMLVHGLDPEMVAKQITIDPPDHLLAERLSFGNIRVLRDVPETSGLRINTQSGESIPRALLSIPLLQRGTVVGVVGLASLYDYDDAAQQIAAGIGTSLAQALEVCVSFESSERMRKELDSGNQELRATNEELITKSEELEQQADRLRTLAEELEVQRHQVSQADKLKSEFLSNMSHELRTPLNSVLSLSQLMLEDGEGARGGETKERLEIIERNGRQLLNLINDILDLSKIESGKLDLFVSSFAVAELVDTAVSSIRPLADEKGLALTVETSEIDGMQSDKDKLQQILLNLLSNAQKFTEKGDIVVSARQDNESLVLSVRDTGCGIPEDELPHIFDEFRQVDGSTSRLYGGTGLGLAISQRLATLLGGKLDVQSELGKGSLFTVTLPMAIEGDAYESEDDRTAVVTDVPKWQSGSAAPHILLVEDNQMVSAQVATALEAGGFTVDTAGNGEEGLARINENLPDGMVLDLMMPEVDGFQVLEAIRSTPETACLPVLVLTAKDLTAAERASLSNNNVHELIQKGSVDRFALVEAVRRLIGMQDEQAAKVKRYEEVAARAVEKKAGKLVVLVADDNADNMMVTKAILRKMDIELLEAVNGEEAVAVTRERHPDIILMDVQMPVMDGIEATQIIKGDEDLHDTVIVAVTGKAMMGDREDILMSGCDDYLSKPVAPADLKAMLRKWTKGA